MARFSSRLRAGIAGAVLYGAVAAGAPAFAAEGVPSLWGTVAFEKDNLAPFPKWTEALDRFKEEAKKYGGDCKVTAEDKCHYKTWTTFLSKVKNEPDLVKLEQVNAFMNQAKYVVDEINWSVKDYWATPGQFFSRFGDCEDYAVAKFMSLAALGYDRSKMKIVVLQDLNLKVPHAVLAVELDGKTLILDNQIKQVIDADRIRHYRPVYSVNEKAWWLHKQAG
jgi:predicted transglutaminase-like cysteine proteinase